MTVTLTRSLHKGVNKIKHTFKILILLLALVSVTVGGTFATWNYATQPADSVEHRLSFEIGDFLWDGSGDLPTDTEVGENHVSLIDNIINHPEHGLNASGSYLNEQIDARQSGGIGWRGGRDTLGSMAVTQSDELDEIFGLSASELSFLIQFVSSTKYYLFTTGVDLGERGECSWLGYNTKPGSPNVAIGDPVYPIYKTVVDYVDGKWTATSTVVGYADSAWYEESRSNANVTQIPSFDPDTFTEGEP